MNKQIKLTEIEKDTILSVLCSCENIFQYDDVAEGYTDQGNFLCVLKSKAHVKAIKSAYSKIIRM